MRKKIAIILLFLVLLFIGLIVLPKNKKPPLDRIQPTAHLLPAETASQTKPSVTAPLPREKVGSPLTVRGTVPASWMFEGVFPVKLLDAKRNVIAETQAREVVAGSWSSGRAVEFTATLNFSSAEKNGYILLEKDNPSGLPEQAASYEIPVGF